MNGELGRGRGRALGHPIVTDSIFIYRAKKNMIQPRRMAMPVKAPNVLAP
jgi:hypothetical protein